MEEKEVKKRVGEKKKEIRYNHIIKKGRGDMEEKNLDVVVAELRKDVMNLKDRVDGIAGIVEAVHSLASEMSRQTEEIKHMNQSIKRLETEMTEVKGKPADRWETVVSTFIGAIVGAIVARF